MSQQFSSEMECRQYYIELGRGTFALNTKDFLAYVSEQVKAFQNLQIKERAATECAAAQTTEERIKLAMLEAEERAAARKNQLTLARLELESKRERDAGTPARMVEDEGRRLGQVVMPPFDPKTETIDGFMTQFEPLATAQQLPPQHSVTCLLTFFRVQCATCATNNLPLDAQNNFGEKVLLHHFQLTAETYLKLFGESTKKATETHGQFHGTLRVHFDKALRAV